CAVAAYQSSTNATACSVSQSVSSVSVVTRFAASGGNANVAYVSAGSHGCAGTKRRPSLTIKRTVAANASAPGNRAASSLRPNTATLAATLQYVSGGFAQCSTSGCSIGFSQSPVSSMFSATFV